MDDTKFTVVHNSYKNEYIDWIERNFADQKNERWFYTGEFNFTILEKFFQFN